MARGGLSRAAAALPLLALACSAASRPAQPVALPVYAPKVLASYPHDGQAFTQGLIVRDGKFYESTGQYGASTIREVEIASGKVLRQTALPSDQFGEGLTDRGAELISLTWTNGVAHRWRPDTLKATGSFRYEGEGWGLAHDGRYLILSDGTPRLRLLDPDTFRLVRMVTVTSQGQELFNLNELEWVEGELLANIWHDTRIARIDLASGRVKGWLDLAAIESATPRPTAEAVLNGIAWDNRARALYVTGKYWPRVYRIEWPVKGN